MTVVGVIGGGQLARMMIPAAINLGIELRVFAEAEDSSARIAASTVGDYTDSDQVLAFAQSVAVVTFDHEHVPLEILARLVSEGIAVFPPPEALALTQDKTVMRAELARLDIPQPRWTVVEQESPDAPELVGGFPCIAKLPVGGYDGKGVRVIHSWNEVRDWLETGAVLLEELVSFRRELSQLSARRPSGEWSSWPLVETRQDGGVCSVVVSPAPGIREGQAAEAQDIAQRIATKCNVVGVLAVEMFENHDGRILVNELAMRPHNSGHVLTEQSVTSQFEQHLRAVTDMPLGSTELRQPSGVMANIFGGAPVEKWASVSEQFPEVKFHSYQKAFRPGRKAGHLVVTGENATELVAVAEKARDTFKGGEPWEKPHG
jgi:5-(carboxyamino)imidazole ribonucleotide synthase